MAKVEGAEQVIGNYHIYTEQSIAAGYQAANAIADWLQGNARATAPWQDITGEARGNLNGYAAIIGAGHETSPLPGAIQLARGGFPSQDCIVATLAGESDHSGYLELNSGGQYAVVWDTVVGNASGAMRLFFDSIVQGRFGG
jgi:hypothetical protein